MVVTDRTAAPDAGRCPCCGWPAGPDDNFCEACRTDLRQPPAAGDFEPPPRRPYQEPGAEPDAIQTLVSGDGDQCATSCRYCPSAEVSADGYCESCGRKLPAETDHVEFDLGLLAGVTDRGLRHSRNEDALALAIVRLADGPVAVAAVCDGVSSSPRPHDASRAAAQALVQVTTERLRAGEDPGAASARAVECAQDAVAALVPPEADTPAATFVSAVLTSEAVTLCWLGDSRGYWLGTGPGPVAERLTADDSVAAEMVAAGLVSESEALVLPQAHVVTRWIGADLGEAGPHVARFEPPGPGVLLLCSDGLWNYQPDAAELARMVMPAAVADPLAAAARLVEFAIEAGGADNITAVLAPFPLAFPPRPPVPDVVPDAVPDDLTAASSAASPLREEQP
jgi:serine/threonine protein phosphatase PrpC